MKVWCTCNAKGERGSFIYIYIYIYIYIKMIIKESEDQKNIRNVEDPPSRKGKGKRKVAFTFCLSPFLALRVMKEK